MVTYGSALRRLGVVAILACSFNSLVQSAYAGLGADELAQIAIKGLQEGRISFGRIHEQYLGRPLESAQDFELMMKRMKIENPRLAEKVTRDLEQWNVEYSTRPQILRPGEGLEPLAGEVRASGETQTSFRSAGAEFLAGGSSRGLREPLSEAEIAQLIAGKPIAIKIPVPGSEWPQVKVKQFVRTSPEHMASIMTDAGFQKELVPELAEAKLISKQGNTYVAQFALKAPFPIRKIEYQLVHEVTQPSPGVYRVEWKMLGESKFLKGVQGSATFEPFRDGTLFTYDNMVSPSPKIPLIQVLEGQAYKGAIDTAKRLSDGGESVGADVLRGRVERFLADFRF